MKKILISGIKGQLGSILADKYLEKNCEVFGIARRTSLENNNNIVDALKNKNFHVLSGDLADLSRMEQIVDEVKPNIIINAAAQSFVGISWTEARHTADVTAIGALNILEALKKHAPNAKFCQLSSSEMYGKSPPPQNENSIFYPLSPYATAKLFAHWSTINYRESFGLKACCAICFNFESERRGVNFVTQKIANGVADIQLGLAKTLALGSLDSRRDWSSCYDIADGIMKLVESDYCEEFVFGSGENHSVKDFCELAFSFVGKNYQDYVVQDPNYMRPNELRELRADPTKARTLLGWQSKATFKDLVYNMVESAIRNKSNRS